MINEDLITGIEVLKMKLSALNHHEHSHLESIETSLTKTWCKENKLANEYMKEVNQDLYISTTLISDIEKDVERLYEEICKEKASTSHNFGELDVPATDD